MPPKICWNRVTERKLEKKKSQTKQAKEEENVGFLLDLDSKPFFNANEQWIFF